MLKETIAPPPCPRRPLKPPAEHAACRSDLPPDPPLQAAQATRKASDPLRALTETAQSMQLATRPPDELALLRAREGAEAHKNALLAASKAVIVVAGGERKGGSGTVFLQRTLMLRDKI